MSFNFCVFICSIGMMLEPVPGLELAPSELTDD